MVGLNIFSYRCFHNIISYSLVVTLLLVCGLVSAQSVSVKGIVTEANGNPMIGVSIGEKNTSNGTITDIDGSYSLKVNSKASILVFNYLGYATKEVTCALC